MISNNSRLNPIQKGFTLLEALIALVVLAVGMVGVIQFQSTFLGSLKSAELRSTAMSLAEREIEGLRNFETGAEFQQIVTSQALSPVTLDGITYSLRLDVEAYSGDGVSVAETSSDADYKRVLVSVNYTDGSIELGSLIAKIDPRVSGYLGSDGSGGTVSQPTVSYTPGEAPDVIKIQIGDETFKETSKPLPDVTQKGTSTLTNFEVITYQNTGDTVKQIQEDFITVNCRCKYDGTGGYSSQPLPLTFSWNQDSLSRAPVLGEYVTKISASTHRSGAGADSDQPVICDRCCAGHHDALTTEEKNNAVSVAALSYDPFRPRVAFVSYTHGGQTLWDHKHYADGNNDGDAGSEVSPLSSGYYEEACRFKRVDGFYRLMQDWRQVSFNVMPYDALATSDAQSSYEDYVVQKVYDYVIDANPSVTVENFVSTSTLNDFSSSSFPTAISVAKGSSTQLMSRALYIDEISSDLRNYLVTSGAVSTATDSWLAYVPFYEVNTTILSRWAESDGSDITVTNEDIVTVVDTDLDYYGVYSRGLVEAPGYAASDSVYSWNSVSNTGLTGSVFIDPLDGDMDENNTVSSAIRIDVSSSLNFIAFSGTISCVNRDNSGDKCVTADYDGLTVSAVGTPNGSCTVFNAGSGASIKYVYNCEVTIAAGDTWGGIIEYDLPSADWTPIPDYDPNDDGESDIDITMIKP